MKRSLLLVFVTAWLMVPSLASADHGIESARGGGAFEEPFAFGSMGFAAQEGPSGVRGSYHRMLRVGGGTQTFRGEVDCLNVVGNTATISGEIVHRTGAGNVVDRFMIIATDNGHPEEGMTTDLLVERLFFPGFSTTDPATCISVGASVDPFGNYTRGNVVVHDDV